MEVLSNPYTDFQEQLKNKLAKQKAKEEEAAARKAETERKLVAAAKRKALPDTVGKYMASTTQKIPEASTESKVQDDDAPRSKKIKSGGFQDFDAF